MKTKTLIFLKSLKKVLWNDLTKTALTIFVVIVGLVLLAINGEPVAKVYSCQQFSTECELEKDQIAILPIEFDAKLLDPYGHSIDKSKNQWYVVNKKVRILVPTSFNICLQFGSNGCMSDTDYPSPAQIMSHYSKTLKVDTVDVSAFIPGVTKAAIIVSGPNEVCFAGSNRLIVAYAPKVSKN